MGKYLNKKKVKHMNKRGYIMQFIFIGVFVIIYGLLNYYIGIRGYNGISAKLPVNRLLYWIIIIFFAASYIIGMAGRNYLPEAVGRILNTVGGYWIAAFVYLLGFAVIIDVLGFIGRKLDMIPGIIKNNTWFIAFAVIATVAILLAVGTYNAIVPKISEYDIKINKKAGNIKQLKCAMISDVHLGEIVGRDRLRNAVELINGMEPDMVFITGDLIDGSVKPVKKGNMLEELKGIKARSGVYFITGNHEHYSNAVEEITEMIEETGVTVLRDKTVKINDSLYIVGREDMDGQRFGHKRAGLTELLEGVDTSLPVIVLDHQPSKLDEPRKAGVDLQLSGHTHAGQFFPASLVTNMMFEEDFGYLKDGGFNLVVSCGYGTWGPTVRIGSQSEIIKLNIAFAE